MSALMLSVGGLLVTYVVPILGALMILVGFIRGIIELKKAKGTDTKKWASIVAIIIGSGLIVIVVISVVLLYAWPSSR